MDQTAHNDGEVATEHTDLKIAQSFLARVTGPLEQREHLPNYLRPIWDIQHSIVGQTVWNGVL
jgi:hypothetical protein